MFVTLSEYTKKLYKNSIHVKLKFNKSIKTDNKTFQLAVKRQGETDSDRTNSPCRSGQSLENAATGPQCIT